MKKFKHTRFTLFLLFILQSCATQNLYTPTARMLSPEAQGKLGSSKIELRRVLYREDKVSFANDDVKQPFKFSGSSPSHALVSLNGEVGLLDSLDIFLNPNIGANAPTIFGVKYQLLGRSSSEAEKGNFSMALHAGVGHQKGGETESNDVKILGTYTDKGDNIKAAHFQTKHREIGALVGYRWHKRVLHYAGASYFHQDIFGNVSTEDKILVKKGFNLEQNGQLYNTGLMYYFEKTYLKIELSHLISGLSHDHSRAITTYNLGFGFLVN